jgi:hypothetical protein
VSGREFQWTRCVFVEIPVQDELNYCEPKVVPCKSGGNVVADDVCRWNEAVRTGCASTTTGGGAAKVNIPEGDKQATFRARRFPPEDGEVQHRRVFG